MNRWHRTRRASIGPRISRRRLIGGMATGAAGLSAAVLVGCGTDDEQDGTTPPAGGGTAQPSPTSQGAAAEPRRGGTLIVPIAAEPPHLDISGTLAYGLHTPVAPLYSRVVRTVWPVEAEHRGDFSLMPDLADDWEVVDPQTYRFHLRSDATWHDVAPVNGRSVEAEDVKVTIDHYRSEGAHRAAFSPVADVETPDAQTVVVHMSEPFTLFLETLSNSVRHVFAPEALEREGGLEATPVIGTGAFVFESFQRGDRLIGKKNPQYFLSDFPYLDGYELRFIPDAAARIAAFRAGQVDYVGLASWDAASEVLDTNPDAQHEEGIPAHSTFSPAMDLRNAPFNDERVRRAMSLASDRQSTIDSLFSGKGITGWGVPWVFAQDEPWSKEQLGEWVATFDPEQAKQLLSAAGHENGFQTTLRYFKYSEVMESQIQLFQADMLAYLNIDIQLTPMEYAGWFETYTGMQWDGMAWGFQIGTSATTDDFMYSNLHSQSPANYYYVNDPAIDDLTQRIRQTVDLDERREMVREVHSIDVDQVYRLPAPQGNGHALIQPRVQGWQPPLQYRSIGSYGSAAFTKMWVTA